MKILIADDDRINRRLLQAAAESWGYDVVESEDGQKAWDKLQEPDAPRLVILDWEMPRLDGVEVCKRAREHPELKTLYILLLTSRKAKEDQVSALESGADDFLTKPFDRDQLRARLGVGLRVLGLQEDLARRVGELEQALGEVKALQSLLPMCAYCKKVREGGDYWSEVEAYLAKHSEARFSHGICPDCYDSVVQQELAELGIET